MSTTARATRDRSLINLFIILLLAAAALIAINVFFGARYAGYDTAALRLAAQVQVDSQQIAKFAQEASSGGLEAFDELATTRDRIEASVVALETGDLATGMPGYAAGPAGDEVRALRTTWEPIRAQVNSILDRKNLVVGAAETASDFASMVPDLQALFDEVVRNMASGGAPVSQIYPAVRQIVLADRMLRYSTQILQGGSEAISAADRLSRDAAVFKQVLVGLINGNPELGVERVQQASARAVLTDVQELNSQVEQSVEAILTAATELYEVKEASNQIFLSSDDLLASAQDVSESMADLPLTRPFPSTWMYILGGVLGALALAGLLFSLYRDQLSRYRLTTELNQRNQDAILRLLDEMGSLAEGDLTVKATVTEDITGAIADSINFAVEALRSLVETINETAVQVAAAAQETQATAMHLAEAAEHQAQQITSASAAINEIAVSIDEVSKNSAESADVAQRSVEIAAKGAEVVRQTIQGMDSIRDQIQETSKRIKRLGESSQEIGSIVELINDISEQTNILALNAAIQAASAGEAGRGFAVVADEVQRLAERASNATKRIETLVQTIQADTNEAVSSMEQTTAEVVAGARLAEDAGLALGEIEKVSNDLADLIQNISEAARQQSSAATNISATMNVIQEITTQTSVGASQTAESIGNLAQLAADLRRSVADFKLPG